MNFAELSDVETYRQTVYTLSRLVSRQCRRVTPPQQDTIRVNHWHLDKTGYDS